MTRRRSLLWAVSLAVLLGAAPGQTRSGETPVSLEAWREAADGRPLEVRLRGRTYRLVLTENPLLTPEAVAGLARQGIDATGIRTLGGTVLGVPGSVVRVTVTEDWAAGVILAGGRRLEVVPAPGGSVVRRQPAPIPSGRTVDHDPGETEAPEAMTDHTLECLSPTPRALANPSGLLGRWPTRTLQMAVAVDQAFVAAKGVGWAAAAAALISGVDGIFESEIGVGISIVNLHSHTSELTSANADTLLAQLKSHYTSAHAGLAREDTALLTGKVLEGEVVGKAECIGGAGDKDLAYQLSQAVRIDPWTPADAITLWSNAYIKIAAHELGHIFNAHHHYADCAEGSRSPLPDVCTLMTPFLDLLDEEMGALERLVMRGWADAANL